MPQILKRSLPALATAALLVVVAPRAADASFTATIQLQPQQASVTVGSALGIDVYLRAPTDTNVVSPTKIAAVDMNFGGTTNATNPLKFVATPAAPLGFAAAGAFAAALPNVFDASLLNGYSAGFADLSYSVANNDFTGGVATNVGDLLIGTLFVTATQTGIYSLSANHAGTALTANDDNATAVTLSHLPATFAVVVAPEPATLAAVAGTAGLALTRRRRR